MGMRSGLAKSTEFSIAGRLEGNRPVSRLILFQELGVLLGAGWVCSVFSEGVQRGTSALMYP